MDKSKSEARAATFRLSGNQAESLAAKPGLRDFSGDEDRLGSQVEASLAWEGRDGR